MTVIERRELKELRGGRFSIWLLEQRKNGRRVLLAADESHVLAVTADHNIRQGVIPA